ncbi:YetF domain-containing protein [Aquisalibacillus elongatus]|uniref:Uncharacterized membrane protein YcaP (DUF421 family) n=1 Tax=Aquisalibacillus elongatus TaxID=485577 RepID=A0A3N5BYE3_9BACI|nr:DUF421 domain-containing protein [Aquisalibacillus elongatus]RPF52192.1 uncharacterized membrane protein YcaP (DUF421 family) [Aquisalibacillus elongatus]
MELDQLILRLFLAFFILLVLARLMGKKEISQLTFFNFVSAISIGAIAASFAIDSSLSIRNGIIALLSWTVFTLLMGYIDIKFKKVRKYSTGEPIIVIKEGKIMEESLQHSRLDMDSLKALLRKKNVFNLTDVKYAIFETSGELSVMKYSDSPNQTVYPTATEVVSDGVINYKNLSRLDLDEKWVKEKLNQNGIQSLDEVFYAEVQPDGSLYIDQKDDDVKH